MADKLKQFMSNLSSWYDLWETPFVFLGVDSCNADESHTFYRDICLNLKIKSELNPLFYSYNGTALFEIYMESILKVLVEADGKYSEIEDEQQRKAVETLIKLMKNLEEGGNHFQCISLLTSTTKMSEAQIQAVLACHLFSPLLTEGKVIVNNKCTSKAECPFCKDPLTEDNTNFGVQDLWHGRADIVIKTKDSREVVTVTVDEEEEEEDTEEGGDQPAAKKPRADDECFRLAEVKTVFDGPLTRFIDEKTYKKAISQTILNAFLAVKKNKNLENTLIPSFLVCQSSVFINFYDAAQDVLLVQSKPVTFFEGAVNYYAFFSVWMALNFQFFPSEKNTQFYSTPTKSGFITWLKKAGVLAKYKNQIEDQLKSARRPNDSQFIRIVVPYPKRNEIISHWNTLRSNVKK